MIIPQNNATATRQQAKELYLKRQRSKVIEQLKGAGNQERIATIKHIDSILNSVTPEGKTFWLKVRRDIEKQIEQNEVKK